MLFAFRPVAKAIFAPLVQLANKSVWASDNVYPAVDALNLVWLMPIVRKSLSAATKNACAPMAVSMEIFATKITCAKNPIIPASTILLAAGASKIVAPQMAHRVIPAQVANVALDTLVSLSRPQSMCALKLVKVLVKMAASVSEPVQMSTSVYAAMITNVAAEIFAI
jgi:hypothetical protein